VDIKTVKASMESSRVAPKRGAEPEASNAKGAPTKKQKKQRAPKLRGGGLKLLMQEQLIQPGVGVRACVQCRAMPASFDALRLERWTRRGRACISLGGCTHGLSCCQGKDEQSQDVTG
jgi:hypothetical protein